MKKLILFAALILALSSCTCGSKYKDHIVRDLVTGDTLILKYNVGDTYFIEPCLTIKY